MVPLVAVREWLVFETLPSFLCQVSLYNNQSGSFLGKNTLLIINEPVTGGFQQKSHAVGVNN